MPQHPTITLRYFDARGRAQPQRYYFAARGIAYTDERVSLTPGGSNPWLEMRRGSSARRPVPQAAGAALRRSHARRDARDQRVPWHRELGDEALLSETENLRHAMLVSSLYSDIVMSVGTTLWAEAISVASTIPRSFAKCWVEFAVYSAASTRRSRSGGWAACDARPARGCSPTACCGKSSTRCSTCSARHVGLDNLPTLSRLYLEAPGRAVFQKVLASHPAPITGRGSGAETEIIGRIRSYSRGLTSAPASR
jgi:hypothetical protein